MSHRTYQPLPMHRIPYTDLTEAQVLQALKPTARWESGRIAASYVRTPDGWKLAVLRHLPS